MQFNSHSISLVSSSMRLIRQVLIIATSCVALSFIGSTQAQSVKVYEEKDKLNAQEIADILTNSLRNKTRGIRYANGSTPAATSSASSNPAAAQGEGPDAFSLPVPFAFDSARLMPAASEQLDAVAEAIKMLEGQVALMIEGHTDANGKANYNLKLSQRRAESVQKYLVQKHGIDVQLLKTEGKGSVDPINKQNPYSGENRRVQFRAG